VRRPQQQQQQSSSSSTLSNSPSSSAPDTVSTPASRVALAQHACTDPSLSLLLSRARTLLRGVPRWTCSSTGSPRRRRSPQPRRQQVRGRAACAWLVFVWAEPGWRARSRRSCSTRRQCPASGGKARRSSDGSVKQTRSSSVTKAARTILCACVHTPHPPAPHHVLCRAAQTLVAATRPRCPRPPQPTSGPQHPRPWTALAPQPALRQPQVRGVQSRAARALVCCVPASAWPAPLCSVGGRACLCAHTWLPLSLCWRTSRHRAATCARTCIGLSVMLHMRAARLGCMQLHRTLCARCGRAALSPQPASRPRLQMLTPGSRHAVLSRHCVRACRL
jgi:hypothetical protein